MSIGCPKPASRERKPRRPLKRTWMKRSTKPLPKHNAKRVARKAKAYRTVLASDFHKKLRYDAYLRSRGLCECEECVEGRKLVQSGMDVEIITGLNAVTPIPVWFTKSGGEPHRRFRSTDGELHHVSYKFFADENPAELAHVRWVWKTCHRRIEAEHGTRRTFLKSR